MIHYPKRTVLGTSILNEKKDFVKSTSVQRIESELQLSDPYRQRLSHCPGEGVT